MLAIILAIKEENIEYNYVKKNKYQGRKEGRQEKGSKGVKSVSGRVCTQEA